MESNFANLFFLSTWDVYGLFERLIIPHLNICPNFQACPLKAGMLLLFMTSTLDYQ